MKIIAGIQVEKANPGRRRKARAATGEKFVLPGPGSTAVPNRVKASAALAVDGLLSVQEVDPDAAGCSAALQLAKNLLDALDEVRHGLLLGIIPRDRLQRLLHYARQRISSADPQLAEILHEIEVRAAVELAKLESAL